MTGRKCKWFYRILTLIPIYLNLQVGLESDNSPSGVTVLKILSDIQSDTYVFTSSFCHSFSAVMGHTAGPIKMQ